MVTAVKCDCGNDATQDLDEVPVPYAPLCEWCASWMWEPVHSGHMSLFGTYWCDTCDSPYCEQA